MPINASKVAVVVLCWNGRKLLQEFLPSLIEFQAPDSTIVVADNFSNDGSVDFVRTNFPSVKLLPLGKNYGFAAGYNEAISRIDSEYIVVINQDIAVTKDWLPPLLAVMENDPAVGAVQPRIRAYLKPSYFEYAGAAGGWIDKYGYTFCRGRIFDSVEEDLNQYNEPSEIFWASGACCLVRKSVFEQLGGFDADLFAQMEEIDLCWRMKNAGYKIMYTPESTVYHLGGGSLPQGNPFKTYLNFRNNLVMMKKNLPKKIAGRIILIRIMLDQVAAFRSLLSFHPRDFSAVMKAHFYYLSHRNRIKKKRMDSLFPAMTGVFHGSVVWDYFIRKKRKFSELVTDSND